MREIEELQFPLASGKKGSCSSFEDSSNFRQKSHWQGAVGLFNSWLDFSHSDCLSTSVD